MLKKLQVISYKLQASRYKDHHLLGAWGLRLEAFLAIFYFL